jgi:ribonuclease Z
MKLLLLGTTGYHPNDRRHTSCFMLPSCGVVFDAGTGFYRVREHLTGDQLDIFLSHAHLDHVFGLTYLWDVIAGRTVDVRVHGAREKLAAIDRHLFAVDLFPAKPPFRYEPLVAPVELADGGRLTWFPLEHPGGSLGYRIDWSDRSMAYVTDTTADPHAPYVDRIRGVDLLIHECQFPDGNEEFARKTGHSCTTPVAQVAAAAQVKRLLLVHVDPLNVSDDPIGLATARRIFPATELGCDGREIEF